MALTLSDLRTLTKQLVGNRSSTLINDAWYTARVNSGYRRICTFQGIVNAPGVKQPAMRRLGFMELQERTTRSILTTATSNFILPATPVSTAAVVTVLDIYDATNNRALGAMSMSDVRSNDPDATGRPTRFCPSGNNTLVGYYIDRRPAVSTDEISIYEYTYTYPVEIIGDTQVPIIPDPWHMSIAYAAASEAADLLDMPDKKQELEQRFLALIAERKSPMEEAGYRGIGGARRYSTIGSRY